MVVLTTEYTPGCKDSGYMYIYILYITVKADCCYLGNRHAEEALNRYERLLETNCGQPTRQMAQNHLTDNLGNICKVTATTFKVIMEIPLIAAHTSKTISAYFL